jgi:type VI protein secretion system component VasA
VISLELDISKTSKIPARVSEADSTTVAALRTNQELPNQELSKMTFVTFDDTPKCVGVQVRGRYFPNPTHK